MSYHYTESGLDYVFLQNGYQEHNEDGEVFVSFDDITEMNRAIAKIIIMNKPKLEGQDLKFLRTLVNLSQEAFGRLISVSRDGVAKAEATLSKELSPPMDKLTRIFAMEYIDDSKIRALIDRLGETEDWVGEDMPDKNKMCIERSHENVWTLCKAA